MGGPFQAQSWAGMKAPGGGTKMQSDAPVPPHPPAAPAPPNPPTPVDPFVEPGPTKVEPEPPIPAPPIAVPVAEPPPEDVGLTDPAASVEAPSPQEHTAEVAEAEASRTSAR